MSGSEAASTSNTPAPVASTSISAAPNASPAKPSAEKPKRKRPTKATDKAPGPGKSWRKGLKGALGKKPLEYDADGKPVAPSPDAPAVASPSASATASPKPPRSKKAKTQGMSPAPEAPSVNRDSLAVSVPGPGGGAGKAANAPIQKAPAFAKTPEPRHWNKTQKAFANVAGSTLRLPVLMGDDESPFAQWSAKSKFAKEGFVGAA